VLQWRVVGQREGNGLFEFTPCGSQDEIILQWLEGVGHFGCMRIYLYLYIFIYIIVVITYLSKVKAEQLMSRTIIAPHHRKRYGADRTSESEVQIR